MAQDGLQAVPMRREQAMSGAAVIALIVIVVSIAVGLLCAAEYGDETEQARQWIERTSRVSDDEAETVRR